LPDIDNIAPFENTAPINQNKKGKIKKTLSRLIRLVDVVLSKCTIFSVTDTFKSLNERTCTDQQKNFTFQGFAGNADKLIRHWLIRPSSLLIVIIITIIIHLFRTMAAWETSHHHITSHHITWRRRKQASRASISEK